MKDWLILFFGLHANTGWGDISWMIFWILVVLAGFSAMFYMYAILFGWVPKALASQLAASENIKLTIERLVRIIMALALFIAFFVIGALVYRL